jgi:hypothetical protein
LQAKLRIKTSKKLPMHWTDSLSHKLYPC